MKEFREIELNAPQLAAVLSVKVLRKTKIYLEWARGTGKSFILAFFMRELVLQMPGGSFALVGSTYQQILSRTLPSTKKGLALLGLFEGVDYVIGKSGDRLGFAPPIYAPDKWGNIIHFSNGAVFQLVSLDSPDSGRGLNSMAILGDEAALLDPERLYNNVKTTNRAKEERFKDATLLGAEIYASSTPLSKRGKWFIDMEKEAKKNPKKYAFIKASSLANANNLRSEWFEEMRLEAPSEVIYNAEILNIRPKEILNGFYPALDPKKHYYSDYNNDYLNGLNTQEDPAGFDCRQDNDIIKDLPLILSVDWGVFVSLVISQKTPSKYKVLKSMWVKQPQGLEDLISDFAEYYAPRVNKTIDLYYGHDGNQKRGSSSLTYGEYLSELLRSYGFRVRDRSKGKPAARHNDKYFLINTILRGSSSRLPGLEINQDNNPDLIIGLERTEAGEGKNGVFKVKKDEKNASVKQEHATHLPDAFDIPLFEIYKAASKRLSDPLNFPSTL